MHLIFDIEYKVNILHLYYLYEINLSGGALIYLIKFYNINANVN